jgi:hypothetical protein
MDLPNRKRTSYLSDVVLYTDSNCQANALENILNAMSYHVCQRHNVITYLQRL